MTEEFQEEFSNNLQDKDVQIKKVDTSYRNTRTRKVILDNISQMIKHSGSFSELFVNSLLAKQYYSQFDSFKKINLIYAPGKEKDQVKVIFDFQESSKQFLTGSYFFDRDGQAMMQVRGGLRNYLGLLDNIFIEYNKSLTNSNKNAYHLTLSLPYLFKFDRTALLQYNIERRQLFMNYSELIKQLQVIYQVRTGEQFTLESVDRQMAIRLEKNNQICKYYTNNLDFLPTQKFSLGYSKLIMDSTQKFMNVEEGTKANFSSEICLPFSDAQFLKLILDVKHSISLSRFSHTLKKLKDMNLELSSKVGICKSLFGKELYLSDCFHDVIMRGFNYVSPLDQQQIQDQLLYSNQKEKFEHKFSLLNNMDFFWKASAKINIFQYPGISSFNGRAFYHGSVGYLYRSRVQSQQQKQRTVSLKEKLHNHLRYSAGIGFSADIGMGAKLEFLYNFLSSGNNLDQPQNLQLRISIDD